MDKTKAALNVPHTGIKHTTSSARTHNHSSHGFDWFWLALALLAVVAICLASRTA